MLFGDLFINFSICYLVHMLLLLLMFLQWLEILEEFIIFPKPIIMFLGIKPILVIYISFEIMNLNVLFL